jgi:hypothetical protein
MYHFFIDIQLANVHLASSLDLEAGYLCMDPLDLTRLSTVSGLAIASTGLTANTIHAFSHFVSQKWNFDFVAVDISCERCAIMHLSHQTH